LIALFVANLKMQVFTAKPWMTERFNIQWRTVQHTAQKHEQTFAGVR